MRCALFRARAKIGLKERHRNKPSEGRLTSTPDEFSRKFASQEITNQIEYREASRWYK